MSDGVSTCVHCGQRIVRVNYALGPEWTHQPQGSAFADNTHRFCLRTVATPMRQNGQVLTGQVLVSGNEED